MNPVALLSRYLPNWSIVMGVSAVVGAISAVVAVAAYREVVIVGEEPLPVPGDSGDP